MTRPARVLEAVAMFLHTLQSLGAFLAGVGALLGGASQLVQAVNKQQGQGASSSGGEGSDADPGRVPPGMTFPLTIPTT